MSPTSDALRKLLDAIADGLSKGERPSPETLAKLEELWRHDRPDEEEALKALLTTLTDPTDPEDSSEVAERAATMDAMASRDVTAFRNDPETAELLSTASKAVGATDEPGGWMYPVYFGTDRAHDGAGFSSRRGQRIRYGRCDVWIPAAHRFGEIGRPWWDRWRSFEFRDDRLKIRNVDLFSREDFFEHIARQMAGPGSERHALLYLHGYNVSFTEAAIRAAQIGFDLKIPGATAFFSWPSQGTLLGYAADAATIESSELAIQNFLIDFVQNSGAEVVHILAHSMGNRALLRALRYMAQDRELTANVRFGQIFLAAPDVDQDTFRKFSYCYKHFSQRTTLYTSKRDWAVWLSARLHQYSRVGYYEPVCIAPGVDTICVPDFDVDLIGHSYYAKAEPVLYDIHGLIKHDAPPTGRPRIHAVEDHWRIGQ